MLEAYQFYEDETSQTTGLPLYLTRSGDSSISFEIETMFDAGQAALDQYDEDEAKKEDKPKGIIRYVKAVRMDGSDLPEGGLAREEWFDQMGKTAEERNDPLAGVDEEILDLIWMPEEGEPFDPSWYDDEVQ